MSTVPSIVFLCVHNAGRSQIAAGWARRLADDRIEVFSGGSDPASEVNDAPSRRWPRWNRHRQSVPEAVDGRDRSSCRRDRHHGLGDAGRSSRASATRIGRSTIPPGWGWSRQADQSRHRDPRETAPEGAGGPDTLAGKISRRTCSRAPGPSPGGPDGGGRPRSSAAGA